MCSRQKKNMLTYSIECSKIKSIMLNDIILCSMSKRYNLKA